MEVIRFGTTEEMLKHLRRTSVEAHNSLHPAQEQITFGDCWVQFHDIANRHLVFGRVLPLTEMREAEIQCGATKREADAAVEQTIANLSYGYMYGRAYDRFNVEGELGQTHKAHVWPIEESLFLAAGDANWNMDRLPLAQKINLQVAFSAMRNHLRGA